jgi:hypothetical protein
MPAALIALNTGCLSARNVHRSSQNKFLPPNHPPCLTRDEFCFFPNNLTPPELIIFFEKKRDNKKRISKF